MWQDVVWKIALVAIIYFMFFHSWLSEKFGDTNIKEILFGED